MPTGRPPSPTAEAATTSTSRQGAALLRWSHRRRWWLRAAGVGVLALGVLLLVQAVERDAPLAGAVFGLIAWAMQVAAWGWFIPALGRRTGGSDSSAPHG